MSRLRDRRKLYYITRSRLKLILNDLRQKRQLGLMKKLKMWRMGFTSDTYLMYGLDRNDPKLYFSDLQEAMTRFINQPYSEIFNNKIIFERVYSRFVRVPKTFALVGDGFCLVFYGSTADLPAYRDDILNAVEELARKHGKLVVKPVRGAFGAGVMIIEHIEGRGLIVNNKMWAREILEKSFKSLNQYYISEFIEQAAYSKMLYPNASNTMRVLTMTCPESNETFIAAAVKRIGTERSAPVDNNSSGGISAAINIEKGTLSAAKCLSGNQMASFDHHPDSGALINGVKVPNWVEIKKKIIQVAGALPYIKYAGWDIIDKDHEIVIIEGNNNPRCRVCQIHEPLLYNQRVIKFYQYHGLLK